MAEGKRKKKAKKSIFHPVVFDLIRFFLIISKEKKWFAKHKTANNYDTPISNKIHNTRISETVTDQCTNNNFVHSVIT